MVADIIEPIWIRLKSRLMAIRPIVRQQAESAFKDANIVGKVFTQLGSLWAGVLK
jgi:hypothetical protein